MSENAYNTLVKGLKEMGVVYKENADISKLSTILTGKRARLMIEPKTCEEAQNALNLTRNEGLSYYALGGGSNTLFCADDLKTVLISLKGLRGICESGDQIEVACGESAGEVIRRLKKSRRSAIESFVGVPCRIGGMTAMNFGCYGKEMKDFVLEVLAITENGVERIKASDCRFSYRTSRFQEGDIVLGVLLKTTPCDEVISLASGFYEKRKRTQPLDKPTLGCVFKSERMPVGMAIENCGLKGKSVGGARISPKHCGFIENTGGATSEDVLKLMDIVEEKVYNRLAIRLKTEIKRVF